MKTVLVWDLPLRLFHWLLVLLVVCSATTGQIGGNLIDWHAYSGLAIAGLLAFRLVWGVVGSTYARFATFVRGPAAIRAYLRGEWRGLGHNPLGALSVLALLATLIVQVTTGLFGNDDIAFTGPLYPLVDKDTSDRAIAWHKTLVWVLAALVAVHLSAVAFYTRVKREPLVWAMLTGRRPATDDRVPPTRGGGILALLVALALACGTVWLAAGGLNPAPAAPPPASNVGF